MITNEDKAHELAMHILKTEKLGNNTLNSYDWAYEYALKHLNEKYPTNAQTDLTFTNYSETSE